MFPMPNTLLGEVEIQSKHMVKAYGDTSVQFQSKVLATGLVLALLSSYGTAVLNFLIKNASWSWLAVVVLAAEVAFLVHQRQRHHQASSTIDHPLPSHPRSVVETVREYLLQHDVPLDEFLSGWFFGAPLEAIRRGNLTQFLSYGLFYTKEVDLAPDTRAAIEGLVDELEAKLGWTFAPGFDPSLKFMDHLWQPLKTLHLPLLVYWVTEALGWFSHGVLRMSGFRSSTVNGFRYYVRAPSAPHNALSPAGQPAGAPIPGSLTTAKVAGNVPSDTPVVFLHGVLGLVGCLPFLRHLVMREGSRHPLVVLDIRHVSMRYTPGGARTCDEVADALAAALVKEGYAEQGAHIVAHSYGTFVAARLLRQHPDLIRGMILMEPVALLTCWPRLLGTFIYGEPDFSAGFSLDTVMANLRWLCSRELTMSETFCRRFFWSALTIWPQELPQNSLVVLSERDDLVASDVIQQLCSSANCPAKVLVRPGGLHGDVLLHPAWQRDVMDHITGLLNSPAA